MKAIILAGGLGTRLGNLTDEIPKPMVEIGNTPILLHIMKRYAKFGVTNFVILGGYKVEKIKKYFNEIRILSDDVTFVLGENKILEGNEFQLNWNVTVIDSGLSTSTAGRLLSARKYLSEDESFFLTYGDGLSNIDHANQITQFKTSDALLQMTAVRIKSRYGLIVSKGNKVVQFGEKAESDQLINGGFFVASTKIFDFIHGDESFEELTIPRLVDNSHVDIYEHSGFWQSMDTPSEHKALNALWTKGAAPWCN